MLRISRLTDYAVVLATHLAHMPGAEAVSDLARATDLPAPTVSKVLKSLARAGVVTSVRGANGGYRLARPANEIRVVEIITAIEGPIAVTECADDTAGCEHEPTCGVRANWQRINTAVHAALSGVTLEDMAPAPTLVPLLRSAVEADLRRAESHATPSSGGGFR